MQQDVERAENSNLGQLVAWLKLVQIPNFAVASMQKLQKKYDVSCQQLFLLPKARLVELGFKPAQIQIILKPNTSKIDVSTEWLQAAQNRFILHFEHIDYPQLLKQISSPPPIIYGYGDPKLLNRHQLGMVGSRNPSPQGKEQARIFAHKLSESGWVITSGLAMGIDGCSHQGALIANNITVAVLGTAIDKMYPRRHIKLAEQILDNNGVIISEFAPGAPSKPENFPRRNRIISGLSLGTFIVEAAIKSGSLITARYALEQNREVFALPGNINNPLAAGCHYLIQQGAKLVTGIDDINAEFGYINFSELLSSEPLFQNNGQQSLASEQLLDSVDFEVTPLDIVAERSGIAVEILMSKLLEYELCGLVMAVPGGYIKLGEK